MTWGDWIHSELSNGKYSSGYLYGSPLGDSITPVAPYEYYGYSSLLSWFVFDPANSMPVGYNDEIIGGMFYDWDIYEADVSINIAITDYGDEFTPYGDVFTWGPITTEITYGDGIVSWKKAGYGTTLEDAIYNTHNDPNASDATTVEVYSNGYVYAEGYDINGNLVTASLEITGIYSPTFINFTLYYRGEKMDMTSYDYQTWSEITTIFEIFRDCVLVSKKELYDAYEAAGFSDMNYMYFALQPEEENYDWGSALCLPDWQELIEDNPETLVFFNDGACVVRMWEKPFDDDYAYSNGYYIGNIYDGQ